MLGSVSEADDAVQDAWLRLDSAGPDTVVNLEAWLITVVARVCLNTLRSRERRRESPLDVHIPDPIVATVEGGDPEQAVLLADTVGLALMVVLDTLTPPERLALVLHDMFAVPFDDIAVMLDRSPAAARQLASRGRRQVQGQAPAPDPDLVRQREIVEAFFAASRGGDFDALIALLHPDVVFRSDGGPTRPRLTLLVSGAHAVAEQATTRASEALFPFARPVLINGAAGVLVSVHGRPIFLMAFTVSDGKIAAIDVLSDPDRLQRLDLSGISDSR